MSFDDQELGSADHVLDDEPLSAFGVDGDNVEIAGVDGVKGEGLHLVDVLVLDDVLIDIERGGVLEADEERGLAAMVEGQSSGAIGACGFDDLGQW